MRPAPLSLLVTDQIKPYKGGNEAIWSIHRLNIRDKHHTLFDVFQYSSISNIEIQNKSTGEVARQITTYGTKQPPPWYVPIPPGYRVKDKGKLSTSVYIEDVERPDLHTDGDILLWYSNTILKVVEVFERFIN
jgi:hypothetical protein